MTLATEYALLEKFSREELPSSRTSPRASAWKDALAFFRESWKILTANQIGP
jgi:hypothetical protein